MGQFSWLDCRDNSQILDNVTEDVYVLVPKAFGGGHILETCYDGYGRFDIYDIYELVADWNREYLSNHPEFTSRAMDGEISKQKWYSLYADLSIPTEELRIKLKGLLPYGEYRNIGINIACYDEDNFKLKYPIKITHDKFASYEYSPPSYSDENQGWQIEEDDVMDCDYETYYDAIKDDELYYPEIEEEE